MKGARGSVRGGMIGQDVAKWREDMQLAGKVGALLISSELPCVNASLWVRCESPAVLNYLKEI